MRVRISQENALQMPIMTKKKLFTRTIFNRNVKYLYPQVTRGKEDNTEQIKKALGLPIGDSKSPFSSQKVPSPNRRVIVRRVTRRFVELPANRFERF